MSPFRKWLRRWVLGDAVATILAKPQAEVVLIAACLDCKRKHRIACLPAELPSLMHLWEVKHQGHRTEYHTPQRVLPAGLDDSHFLNVGRAPWWLDQFAHNADIKIEYGSSAAFTITLASLASDTNFLAGRESTAVSNTTNDFLDYAVGGKISTGTSPTDNRTIRIYAYAAVDDTPTYVAGLSGSDSNKSMADAHVLVAAMSLFAATGTDTTNDQAYWFHPKGIAGSYRGLIPKNFGLWVVHNTGAALNSTGSNHALSHTGIYATST